MMEGLENRVEDLDSVHNAMACLRSKAREN